MPTFVTPSFNLLGAIWKSPDLPEDGPGSSVDVPMQLYLGSRGQARDEEEFGVFQSTTIYVRMPITQVAPWVTAWLIECPQGSGRYYLPTFKERMHQGFVNEYLVMVVVQCDAERNWIGRDVDMTFPIPHAMLYEDGGQMFYENGVEMRYG